MINLRRIIRTSALKNGLFSHNRFFISAFWLVGMGILVGAVAVGTFSSTDDSIINTICSTYFEKREMQSIFACFIGTFSSSLVTLALVYLLGLCAIGTPFLYFTLVFDSIGKGIVFGYLYLQYGFIGILKSVFFLLPQNALMCLIVISAVKFSVKMSKQIYFLTAYSSTKTDYNLSFKKYNQKYLFYVLCLGLICVFDALMSRFTLLIVS